LLSYSYHDRHLVQPLIDQLSGLGIAGNLEPLDSNILAGEDFRATIHDRVQSANQMVVSWSEKVAILIA
jgi:hypothetical protein